MFTPDGRANGRSQVANSIGRGALLYSGCRAAYFYTIDDVRLRLNFPLTWGAYKGDVPPPFRHLGLLPDSRPPQ